MKELTAITGLYQQMQLIKRANGYATDAGANVVLLRGSYTDADDLPLIAVAPADADSVNNIVGLPATREYNRTVPVVVEGHIETAPDSLDPVYDLFADITHAALSWQPADPSDAITVTYSGRTIAWPDDQNQIATIQVRFDVQFIESLIR